MPQIICLQETKLSSVDNMVIRICLGIEYENNFFFLPADGTRGGIFLAYRDDHILMQNAHFTTNTISATVINNRTNINWTITGVYGP